MQIFYSPYQPETVPLHDQKPLTVKEGKEFASLFQNLVLANNELQEIESRLSEGWQKKKFQEPIKQYKTLLTPLKANSNESGDTKELPIEELEKAAHHYHALHSNQFSKEIDKQFNHAQQKLLDKIFAVVQFLRGRDEKVEWESDTRVTVKLMSKQIELMKVLQIPGTHAIEHLIEERKQHMNHSSELFLRSAQTKFTKLEILHADGEEKGEKKVHPVLTIAQQCVLAFISLRQTIEGMKHCKPISKVYSTLAFRVKDFGSDFKNYKDIALEISNQQLTTSIKIMLIILLHLVDPTMHPGMKPGGKPSNKGSDSS